MFSRRGIVIHPQELDQNWLNRCKALDLNVLGLHPVGGKTADESLKRLLEEIDDMKPLLDRAKSMGIKIEYEMHALSYLMPRTLFSTHPEWFCADENGNRHSDGFNICASNQKGLAALADSAEVLALKLPSDTHMYYFWLDDITDCRCRCEHCSTLTPSDQQMILVNAMLKGIRRVDPKGKLAYLAYADALEVPTHVAPDEGVFLEYAPFRRDVNRSINDPDSEKNRRECAPLPNLLKVFGTKDAKVLDYWTDNSMFSQWRYPPQPFTLNAEVMRKDAAFYRSVGFTSVTAFGCYLGKDYADLYGQPDLEAYGKILSE